VKRKLQVKYSNILLLEKKH